MAHLVVVLEWHRGRSLPWLPDDDSRDHVHRPIHAPVERKTFPMVSYFLFGLLCGFVAAFPTVIVVIRLINWWHRRRFRQEAAATDDDHPSFV